jgi:hypothetical protein
MREMAMPRIRTIKPEFFKHEKLFDAEKQTGLPIRLAFIGLWTLADREGRFCWRPRQLKVEIFPYDEISSFEDILDALQVFGFIKKYEFEKEFYGFIPSWHKHQRVNNRESLSTLPSPELGIILSSSTREPHITHACSTDDSRPLNSLKHAEGERKGRERNMEGERKGKGDSAMQRDASHAFASQPSVVIKIPINTGNEFQITEDQVQQWQSLYPAVDVMQELRNIRGWNLSNPKKRKTKSGILQHINAWLAKEQNRGGISNSSALSNRSPPTRTKSDLYEHNLAVTKNWASKTGTIIDTEKLNEKFE